MILTRLKFAQQTQKENHDKPTQMQVGDRVMVYTPSEKQGKDWKLTRPYYGPYRILSITPTNVEVKLAES